MTTDRSSIPLDDRLFPSGGLKKLPIFFSQIFQYSSTYIYFGVYHMKKLGSGQEKDSICLSPCGLYETTTHWPESLQEQAEMLQLHLASPSSRCVAAVEGVA